MNEKRLAMICLEPLGIIHSPFKEPKGTPIQPPAARDIAGLVNQRVAEAAEEVYWVVCGLPVEVKKPALHITGGRH